MTISTETGCLADSRELLVVGCDGVTRDHVRAGVAAAGHRVTVADDAPDAFRAAAGRRFDALLVSHPLAGAPTRGFLQAVRDPESPCHSSGLVLVAEERLRRDAQGYLGRGANRVLAVEQVEQAVAEVLQPLLRVPARVPLRLPVRLQALGSGLQRCVVCESVNLSLHGALLRAPHSLATGTPLSFYLADHDIDFNTGLIASSHASSGGTKGLGGYDAGLVTDYTYDSLGRLTWAKPRNTPIDIGAWSNYVYTPVNGTTPAKVNIYQYPNNSTSGALSQQEYSYDGFGRVIKQRQLLASGAWNQRLTSYNTLGWKTFVSELQPDGTSGSGLRGTTYDYNHYPPGQQTKDWTEPFGRPLTITPPDGTGHNVTMTYAGVGTVRLSV